MLPAFGDVQEWTLVDRTLHARTTQSLQRYFSAVRPDSVRVRYISKNSAIMRYRLRAQRTANDTSGQLVSLSLGQLSIFSIATLRVALGDDLYHSLVVSRHAPGADRQRVANDDRFSDSDWYAERTVIAGLDRIELRINPALGVFAGAGAPESNLHWWSDGTLRLGVATPNSEAAVLLPFGAGSRSVGPWRSRLLAPGFGAAAMARHGSVIARARITAVSPVVLIPPLAAPRRYVHTLSMQGLYTGQIDSRLGPFTWAAGAGYEEFTAVGQNSSGEVVQEGRVRRLSPIADIAWTTPGQNVRLGLGVADIALRGSLMLQVTGSFAVELKWVANNVFRDPKPFEQPFLLFLTPRVSF